MGMQIYISGANPAIEICNRDGSCIVTELAHRFNDLTLQDPESPVVSPAAMSQLDAEAPRELEAFRTYCDQHCANIMMKIRGATWADLVLEEAREFIADAARDGRTVIVSY